MNFQKMEAKLLKCSFKKIRRRTFFSVYQFLLLLLSVLFTVTVPPLSLVYSFCGVPDTVVAVCFPVVMDVLAKSEQACGWFE